MVRKVYHIQNRHNENIALDFRFEEGSRDVPTILILHGFKGFKDWGFFPNLGRQLTQSGYATVCFNFSRNGIGSNPEVFSEFDKFAENCYSHELEDVQAVLQAIENGTIGKYIIDRERLGILGHSRGGAVALLSVQEFEDKFLAITTWASIANLYRYSEEQIKQWENRGYIEIENARTKQVMRINKSFWDDLQANQERFDLLDAVGEMEIPALFIHGKEDTSVSPRESEELFEHCASFQKKLEIIESAGHTFGIRHPFEIPTPEYELAVNLTENWFDRHLNI
ncbi:MAG TPA: alpha/beta fold hydrolase [Calditrichaeota bacterium]|nr:alpha/beta fold hydrolase [Calditrichota bacterium]